MQFWGRCARGVQWALVALGGLSHPFILPCALAIHKNRTRANA